MVNSRGISSILIVGLVLALTAGVFGVWYMNKLQQSKVVDPGIYYEQVAPTPTITPVQTTESTDLEVSSLTTESVEADADLDKLESQMKSVDQSFNESDLDDLN